MKNKGTCKLYFTKNVFFLLFIAMTCSLFISTQALGDGYERYERRDRYREENKLYGIIEKMPVNGYTGTWIIAGRKVMVSEQTRIKEKYGRAAVGKYVEVEGVQNGGNLIAYKLEVEENRERRRYDDRRDHSKFYGTVETLPQPQAGLNGIWRINGRSVVVNQQTRIKEKYGRVAVGSYVEVKGNYSGNTFTAYEIEVKDSRRYNLR
ncbi:MAG: hypothetical protein D3923_10560 [Candidatus Electrothrix sp. AR3]|nr:hypothetical protein [Candidatus Electrothrix sp. AR3]